MDKRDTLEIIGGEICVPPRISSDIAVLQVPFSNEIRNLAHPYSDQQLPYSFPAEAFDENSGELIVFIESNWASMNEHDFERRKHIGRRVPNGVRPEISDGSFSHELCALNDYSPKALAEFMAEHGLIFLPILNSQKRFIDYRYHMVELPDDDPRSYLSSYPDLAKEEEKGFFGRKKPAADPLHEFKNAACSVWAEAIRQMGPDPSFNCYSKDYPVETMIDAVVLSEYARRKLLKDKPRDEGGVVSYCEVLLAVKFLQKAMKTVMEFEFVKEDPSFLSADTVPEYFDEEGDIRRSFAHELLSDESKAEIRRRNEINNLYQREVRPALQHISLHAFSNMGVSTCALKRVKADPTIVYEGEKIYWTDRIELEDGSVFSLEDYQRELYFRRHYPMMLENRYAEGCYSASVAAQFLNVLSMDLPWKKCKNPECGRLFKLKYAPGKTNSRNRQGDYCCDKCGSDMRNKRNNTEQRVVLNAKRRYSKKEPGYETIDAALASIEAQMAVFYEGEDAKRLPKARLRWREKLTSV